MSRKKTYRSSLIMKAENMRAMRIILQALMTAVVLAAIVFGIRAVAHRALPPETGKQRELASPANAAPSTPADKRIQSAQAKTESAPQKPDGYLLLCSAYMQKARETGDFGFNSRAEAALNRAAELEPENYDALKLRAKLLLTFHRFSEALETAGRAQALRPQDHDVYGALTDAHVELGNYKEAIASAQQMVNLRPDTASYSRISYLRSLHGDNEGAIEAMTIAAKAADPRDPESVAWCLVQLGDELVNAGKSKEAEQQYDAALAIFPDYHPALAAKGRARVAAGDTTSALELFRRAQERVPLPETAIALGDLYQKLGRADEAKRQYELVEFIERTGAASGTYSRTLALFYADHEMKLDEALTIAKRERAARSDIYTSDALAWCLFKKGQLAEARTAMDEALRLKTRDARLFYHAGMIADALGNKQNAIKYLKLALEVNPAFDIFHADTARQTLAKSLEPSVNKKSLAKG
jgi:tetratricopeptide (TPR) repeat protein